LAQLLVTVALPFLSQIQRFPKDSAWLCWKLLRISIPALNRRASAAVQYKPNPITLAHRRRVDHEKLSTAGRFIFWLAIIFTITFLVRAESGDRRASTHPQKELAVAPITIFDEMANQT